MAIEVSEENQGGIRRMRVRGDRTAAFTELGRRLGGPIRHTLEVLPAARRLTALLDTDPGQRQFRAVLDASRQAFPTEWGELAAMAAGAGIPAEQLTLFNLRGDLGEAPAGRSGCSDLSWRGSRLLMGHNEDGNRHYQDLWLLLTLEIEDDPIHSCFWYPGFLPANAFTYTETGLVWTVDNLPAPHPTKAPGRHFVARGLQRRATSAREARAYLMAHDSAGAFAYNVGDASGELFTAEVGAGQRGIADATSESPLIWHTNHGRYMPDPPRPTGGTSLERGRILADLARPDEEPDTDWLLRVLATPPPGGVFASGESVTLVTLAADLRARRVVLKPRGEAPVTVLG